MKKLFLAMCAMTFAVISCANGTSEAKSDGDSGQNDNAQSVVYFTKNITPEGLINIYKALGVTPTGRVAVKISTGESGGHNYLQPSLISPLVHLLNANIVECNTAYGGSRSTISAHRQTIHEHGFDTITTVDIMDEEGEMEIPVTDTKHIKHDIVGSHLQNYDFMVNLAHFKGHAMGGFGGVLKNQSIGVASAHGKLYIHSAGATSNYWSTAAQDDFLESMAAAAQAVANHFGKNIIYIDVMNNLSVDCDCDSHPADPEMKDIGILASTDPVALDKACLDLVFNHQSTSGDNASALIERINSRHGTHTVEYAEQIGLGSQKYRLLDIDEQTSINGVTTKGTDRYNVYTVDGKKVLTNASSLKSLKKGTYIINGTKIKL
jgi:uncharacterized Fe-S center protein